MSFQLRLPGEFLFDAYTLEGERPVDLSWLWLTDEERAAGWTLEKLVGFRRLLIEIDEYQPFREQRLELLRELLLLIAANVRTWNGHEHYVVAPKSERPRLRVVEASA